MDRYAEHLEAIQGNVDRRRLFEGFEAWYSGVLPEDRGERILDFGCGRGDFLAFLKERGFRRIEGLDVIADYVERIEAESGAAVRVTASPREHLAAMPGAFGAIFALDVIEHVQPGEIVPLLQALREALRPGGRLVVSGPHAASLTGLYTRYADPTHTTCFTAPGLFHLLRCAGFRSPQVLFPRIRPGLRPGRWILSGARAAWFAALRCIHSIEAPGDAARPPHFHNRIAVAAEK